MSTIRSAVFLSTTLFLVGTPAASAADLFGGGMKDSFVPMAATAPSPSWYFRVDGAYGIHDDPVMVEDGLFDLIETKIDSTWSVGGGVGYYFSPTFRGDVTYERRFETDAQGNLANQLTNLPGVRTFGLESDVVLFNLYYDFDRSARISPYIGAGLGYVHHTTADGVVDGSCGCNGTIEGETKGHVAGALMAGATIKLLGHHGHAQPAVSIKDEPVVTSSRNLVLDVGYRFLYLGEATTGPVIGNNGQDISNDPTVEDIHAHEIRFGLRYDFR